MKSSMRLTPILLMGLALSAAHAQEAGPHYEHLKPLEAIVGHWKMSGQWTDGTQYEGEERTSWTLDKNFLRTTGWYRDRAGDRVDLQIMTGWDPHEQRIVSYFWKSNGESSKRVGTFDAATGDWSSKESGVDADGNEVSFDVVMRFLDKNRVEWKGTSFRGAEPLPDLNFILQRVPVPTTDAIPPKARAAMRFFVGQWDVESTLNGEPTEKASDSRSWLPGRHAVLMQQRAATNGSSVFSSAICGWDAQGKQIVENWHDSDGTTGVIRYPLEKMKQDTWQGDFDFTRADGETLHGSCVLAKTDDGFEWTATWMENGEQNAHKNRYRRVK